ncbi:MAG: Fe-S cluster assembly ATPase SufC [Pyramidobacter sp.]|jgi:Fe-S cluster assembly ATP-binding protein
MSKQLLQVENLTVSVEEKEILHGVNLIVRAGETHVLMGPNGAGKSTLGNALMGDPRYKVTGGRIVFDGRDLTAEAADVRSKAGMFMSFQTPLEVPGLTLGNFIRTASEQRTGQRIKIWAFRKEMKRAMEMLEMNPDWMDRDLNVGFSGGEKKKAEILQLLMLKPSFAILDETDSGLDVDAVRTVSEGIREYQKDKNVSLLIITHSTRILEALHVDAVHVLVQGAAAASGGPELVDEINARGFEDFQKK